MSKLFRLLIVACSVALACIAASPSASAQMGEVRGLAACPAIPRPPVLPKPAIPFRPDRPGWIEREQAAAQRLASIPASKIDLVVLGDSITNGWPKRLFDREFSRWSAVNLGVGSDHTDSLLWRLENRIWAGGNDALRPRLVVLMIGTGSIRGRDSAEDIALGVAESIRFIAARSPASKILLLGLLPRGVTPDDPQRAKTAAVNALIAKCHDGARVFYADVGGFLLDAQGQLDMTRSRDTVHLTPAGYAEFAAAIRPKVAELMAR